MSRSKNGPLDLVVPLELRWDADQPLPARWVVPDGLGLRVSIAGREGARAFDFSAAMRSLCGDIAHRCEPFAHVHLPRVLISFTPCRNRNRFGLQARITPLRFRNGSMKRRQGPTEYQVQRYFVDDREMLYLLTFCLPRFLDQSFEEKLITVFHELYHIAPAFDGDLRRHPGRYAVHTHSKDNYDLYMAELVKEYLADHPDPSVFQFLRYRYRELWELKGGIFGVVVPRPKILPVGWASMVAAARQGKRKCTQ